MGKVVEGTEDERENSDGGDESGMVQRELLLQENKYRDPQPGEAEYGRDVVGSTDEPAVDEWQRRRDEDKKVTETCDERVDTLWKEMVWLGLDGESLAATQLVDLEIRPPLAG
jgi:hypothetical protein